MQIAKWAARIGAEHPCNVVARATLKNKLGRPLQRGRS